MDRITAPEQFEDKGTRTPAAAPAVRADADVAGAATAAQQALSSGPTGGLAGLGPDVAARVAPVKTTIPPRDRAESPPFDLARCQPRDVSPVIAQGAASQAIPILRGVSVRTTLSRSARDPGLTRLVATRDVSPVIGYDDESGHHSFLVPCFIPRRES